jgi:Uma2 family endonuclease
VSALTERRLVTEEEFLSLPDSMGKIELIDGEVIVPPAPSFQHQRLLTRLVVRLTNWSSSASRAVEIGQSPVDVRFAPNRILQPDAFVLFDVTVPDTHAGPLDHVPAICIEVLSSDRVYDRVTKRMIYAAAGVSELWLVEPAGLIERWSGPGLTEREELREELQTPLLPGFVLSIPVLFGR